MAERREYPRIRQTFVVECLSEWGDTRESRRGVGVDVGAGGLLFQTHEWAGLSKGQSVLLRIAPPTDDSRGGHSRSASTWATIRRVSPPDSYEVAVAPGHVAVQFAETPWREVFSLLT